MTAPSQEYCLIPLTQGQFAKVSPHRFEELNQFKWFAWWNKNNKSFYAMRQVRRADGSQRPVRMHRYILGLTDDDSRCGDHRNHDTLDNTDENLRPCTDSQNNQNSKMKPNSTGYKGVWLERQKGRNPRYRVSLLGKPVKRFPATPDGLVAAARHYDTIASEHFSEFAHLNFPHIPTCALTPLVAGS